MPEGSSAPEIETTTKVNKSPVKKVVSKAKSILSRFNSSEEAMRRAEGPLETSTMGVLNPAVPDKPAKNVVDESSALKNNDVAQEIWMKYTPGGCMRGVYEMGHGFMPGWGNISPLRAWWGDAGAAR